VANPLKIRGYPLIFDKILTKSIVKVKKFNQARVNGGSNYGRYFPIPTPFFVFFSSAVSGVSDWGARLITPVFSSGVRVALSGGISASYPAKWPLDSGLITIPISVGRDVDRLLTTSGRMPK
jgi:hypothetical protein